MTNLKQQLEHATSGQVIPVSGYQQIDNIRWDVPVRIVGDGTAVFDGRGAKRALRYMGDGELRIEGIKFVGYHRAIELFPDNAKRIQILDCEFEDCGTAVYGATSKATSKARPTWCDDIDLSDLYLRGCTERAIDIYCPFASCRVRNSIIDGGGQGAIWLGWSKFGIHSYRFASVSGCTIRNIHHNTDCKGVMIAAKVGAVLGSHFSDIGATGKTKHSSDTCGAYFKCERAIVSHNTFDRACGVVAKESCDLTVDGNLFWTDLEPEGIYRNQVKAISTTKNATVNAYGNSTWGMVIGLASRRRSFVRRNIMRDVPLYRPWGFDRPVAVFYESDEYGFHDISDNAVDDGVFEAWRHEPK